MIEIKKATVLDAKEITELIQFVHDTMEHPEWYAIDDLDFYSHFLEKGKGISYKAVDAEKNKIAGIFMAIIPDKKELNLGYDIGFSEEQCQKTAVMDTAAVLPQYRGQNLQYRLMQAAEAELREIGYQYLTATVHPDNKYSLRNGLKQDYKIMATKEKYGGYLRHILLKELENC